MKYYNITVNGVAYSVSVEETAAGAAPVAAAPAAPVAPKAAPAPAAAPKAAAGAAGAVAVKAPMPGNILDVKVKAGDYVTAGQEIATVRDDSSLLLTLEFPAADASNFAVGQAAQVMLNGTFETLSGTVQAVAGTDTISSGNLLVRTVTIAVPNNGSLTTAQMLEMAQQITAAAD